MKENDVSDHSVPKESMSDGIKDSVKGVGEHVRKTVKTLEYEPEVANPSESLKFKPAKKDGEVSLDSQQKETVSGVESESKPLSTEKELSGETKPKSQPSIDDEKNSVEENVDPNLKMTSQGNSPGQVKKKNEEEDEVEDFLQKDAGGEVSGLDPSLKQSEKIETSLSSAVGEGERAKAGDNLKIDRIIGKQNREHLSNGQQVVSLDIDKEKWLKAEPDKDGNLKITLYSPLVNDKNDNFSSSVIKVPRHMVATMPTDESGRIKLLVAERTPGRESKLDVYMDSPQRREDIAAKNKNLLGEETLLLKEKMLDKPVKHPMFGHEMGFKRKDLVNNMSEEKQSEIKVMGAQDLKEMFNNPKNKELLSEYHLRYENKLAEKIVDGQVEAKALSTVGGKMEMAKVTEAEHDPSLRLFSYKLEGAENRVNTHSEDLSSNVSIAEKDHLMIKNEVLSDIGKEMQLRTPSIDHGVSAVSENADIKPEIQPGITGKVLTFGKAPYQHDPENEDSFYVKLKDAGDGEKVIWGKELEKHFSKEKVQEGDSINIQHVGKEPVEINVPVKDENNKVVDYLKKSVLRNNFEVTKLKDSLKEDAPTQSLEKEKIMDTQITPDTKYKDYVGKMSADDQGAVTKKSAEELAKEVSSKAPDLAGNEHQIKGPGQIKQDGSLGSNSASEKLTAAIYKNDEKLVSKLLQNSENGLGKEHLKLMSQMKEAGQDLSPKIESEVKAAVKPSHKMNMSV